MMSEPPVEEAQIREVSEERPLAEGESVVRLRKERRRWLWIVPLIFIILLGFIVLRSPDSSEGVSLPAAKKVIIEKKPDWEKSAMLRLLRKEGFRATPGPPRSPLQITVSLRRDGLILRSQGDRVWIVRSKIDQRQ